MQMIGHLFTIAAKSLSFDVTFASTSSLAFWSNEMILVFYVINLKKDSDHYALLGTAIICTELVLAYCIRGL